MYGSKQIFEQIHEVGGESKRNLRMKYKHDVVRVLYVRARWLDRNKIVPTVD